MEWTTGYLVVEYPNAGSGVLSVLAAAVVWDRLGAWALLAS
jgi:hypothetical protein